MTLDVWTFIGFLGAAQAAVVGGALLTTPGTARRLYGLLLLDLGLAMAAITWSHAGGPALLVALLEDATSILAPPLFYAFVVLACRGGDPRRYLRRLTVHFALPAGWAVYAATALAGIHDGPRVPILAVVLYQVAYTAVAARQAFLLSPNSGAARSEVRLARVSVVLFFVIHVAQGIRFFVDEAPWTDIVPITAAVGIFTLTFAAARESRVFTAGSGSGPKTNKSTKTRYESSALSEEQAERALEKLRHALDEERVHLRPDLTLDILAEELGLARTYLSQVINEHLDTTFPELLAKRRVTEAKRLLADRSLAHLTVEALGERAGFQSRSAFYAAFKKATGETPAAHRKAVRQTASTRKSS